MKPRELIEYLRSDRFEPCVFVTEAGDRYEVLSRRCAMVVNDGTVTIYKPSETVQGLDDSYVQVCTEKIKAIEPLRKQTT